MNSASGSAPAAVAMAIRRAAIATDRMESVGIASPYRAVPIGARPPEAGLAGAAVLRAGADASTESH